MILPGMKRETMGPKIQKMHAAAEMVFPPVAGYGPVRFAIGTAFYPDDADTSKLLLAIAEGRNEMRIGGSTESLLALHAHNRSEMESEVAEEFSSAPGNAQPVHEGPR
jgi:hypothetical protein